MDEQEYPSSDNESDEDYCPDQHPDAENLSEVESDDNLDDTDQPTDSSTTKRRKKQKTQTNTVAKPEPVEVKTPSAEDDKERADALWADFLTGTDPLPAKKPKTTKASSMKHVEEEVKTETKPEPQKKVVTEIFEFAGEQVKVTKELNDTESSSKSDVTKEASSSLGRRVPFSGTKRASGGGIGSVLGQLTKKSKISVLDKSKLDWNTFKRDAGIDEELQTFNKGKDGYLERQDFLERTDVRQFEIEKSIRLSRRNNRNC